MVSLKISSLFKGLILLFILSFLVSGVVAENVDEQSLENIEALIDSGDYDEAISESNKFLEIYPDDAELWLLLGCSLEKSESFEEALSASEKATELDPDNPVAWKNKGNALCELGRSEEALLAYDKGIELDSEYSLVWYNKGVALMDLERYEEALSVTDKSIDLDPQYQFAWVNKGYLHDELGQYEDSLSAYDKAIELDPDDAEAWNNKGCALDRLERYEEALLVFEKAIELDPNDVIAWNNKGVVLKKLGRTEEANDAFDTANKIKAPNFFKVITITGGLILILLIFILGISLFSKYIGKRKQKKNEKKRAIEREKARVVNKIDSFVNDEDKYWKIAELIEKAKFFHESKKDYLALECINTIREMDPENPDAILLFQIIADDYQSQRKNRPDIDVKSEDNNLKDSSFYFEDTSCPICGSKSTYTRNDGSMRCQKCGYDSNDLATSQYCYDDLECPSCGSKSTYTRVDGTIRCRRCGYDSRI